MNMHHKIFNFDNWTNITKELHPSDNKFGYNTEKNRLEFYVKFLDKWFYLWSEFITITETPAPPYFLENFETGWLIEGTFTKIFEELFENNWFVDNLFSELFIEDFQGIDW